MKKKILLSSVLVMLSLVSGCGVGTSGKEVEENKNPVSLSVTTTWAGNDGGTKIYKKYLQSYIEESGNIVNDYSSSADEIFKEKIQMDFEVGGETDILFYFNGSDADSFIKAGRVVSLDTIREEYPEYGSNIADSALVPSTVDGNVYCLPAYGYWEALFVNKKVCEAAGVEIPDADTTWEEFEETCTQIRSAGYTPIAVSLAMEPHYWFEFAIYNHMSPGTHAQIPSMLGEHSALAWKAGLTDLKDMYSKGYFPTNTLFTSADESFQRFLDGESAFLVEGSWKVGSITSNAEDITDFTVTYVPGKGERKNTDIIGGFSSGWYITTKAWKDPDKRQAAVDFIKHMTSEEAISDFASISVSATALKNGAKYDESGLNPLQKDAVKMLENITSISPAVQDNLSVTSRTPFFAGMPDIVTGRVSVEETMEEFLSLRIKEATRIEEITQMY